MDLKKVFFFRVFGDGGGGKGGDAGGGGILGEIKTILNKNVLKSTEN